MSRLLLIRHGQASFGDHDYDRLSLLGERQARITGRHLARMNRGFDVIVCGTLARQRKTAELAAAAFTDAPDIVTDSAFNEYDAEGLFRTYLPRVLDENPDLVAQRDALFQDPKLFKRTFGHITRHWITAAAQEAGPCETWHGFTERIASGLARLHDDYDSDVHIALFSSGGPIATAIAACMSASAEHTLQLNWSIYNTAISELRGTRNGWRLLGFNDITHLRLAGDSSLLTFL